MEKDMKVAVMTGIGQFEYTRRPVPAPAPGEVLVQLEYVGICGSDVHYFESGRIGDYIVKPPFVLGHECSGVVVATAPGVESPKVGQRVALEPGKTCGHCQFCKSGLYNLCPDVEFFATPPYDGVFQEYVTHPAELCFILPEGMNAQQGALIEPLAVGFHAARQGGAQLGQKAVVFGCGCIGLVSIMALKAMGVTDICAVDVVQSRIDKAIELGASHGINGAKEDFLQAAQTLTVGNGFDLAIETAGSEITTGQAIRAAKKGGIVVLVGYSASGNMNLPVSPILDNELTIKSVFRYRNIYPLAIDAVAAGKVDLDKLVSHTYGFDDLQKAFEACIHDKETVIKAVVQMPGQA